MRWLVLLMVGSCAPTPMSPDVAAVAEVATENSLNVSAGLLIVVSLLGICWVLYRRVERLERLIREDLWAGQVMTWREFCDLPGALNGIPYLSLDDTHGPERQVMAYTRVFPGAPRPLGAHILDKNIRHE